MQLIRIRVNNMCKFNLQFTIILLKMIIILVLTSGDWSCFLGRCCSVMEVKSSKEKKINRKGSGI